LYLFGIGPIAGNMPVLYCSENIPQFSPYNIGLVKRDWQVLH